MAINWLCSLQMSKIDSILKTWYLSIKVMITDFFLHLALITYPVLRDGIIQRCAPSLHIIATAIQQILVLGNSDVGNHQGIASDMENFPLSTPVSRLAH